jgi:hypothetical protein
MSQKWFVRVNEIVAGPFSSAKIREMSKSGRLRPKDEIKLGEMGNWIAASTVKGLFSTGVEAKSLVDAQSSSNVNSDSHELSSNSEEPLIDELFSPNDFGNQQVEALGDLNDSKPRQVKSPQVLNNECKFSSEDSSSFQKPKQTSEQNLTKINFLRLSLSDLLMLACTLALILTIVLTRGDSNWHVNRDAISDLWSSWKKLVASNKEQVSSSWDMLRSATKQDEFESAFNSLSVAIKKYYENSEIMDRLEQEMEAYRYAFPKEAGSQQIQLLEQSKPILREQWQNEIKDGAVKSTVGLGPEAKDLPFFETEEERERMLRAIRELNEQSRKSK